VDCVVCRKQKARDHLREGVVPVAETPLSCFILLVAVFGLLDT
jgi:hypothetical protein